MFLKDAFLTLATTLNINNLAETIPKSPSVSCSKENPWYYGEEFMRYLRLSDFNGLSGHIEFDSTTGCRKNLTIRIVDLIKDGISLVSNSHIITNEMKIRINFNS